ncbi:MAG TPA: hypothetical protein VHC47_07955, partial [Mucilaginibacter sp.]|nr:hypothetical protein [Mucilaginibacter sp.]
MLRRIGFIAALWMLSFYGCKKGTATKNIPPAPAIQYPLLSKMTLTTGGTTYTDTYTYDTTGTFRNNPVQLRSEIAGKIIDFTYAKDIYFQITLDKVDEYDIHTGQKTDTYQYTGYRVLEPGIPPEEKDVVVTDASNNVIKTYSFFRVTVGSLPDSI